ncbi:IS1 family transposase [Salmonella enterica subsp. enterica]
MRGVTYYASGTKIICFSRSIELHEKVKVSFIEKYMFC